MARSMAKMSSDELIALNQELMIERDKIHAKQDEIMAELNNRSIASQIANIPQAVKDVIIQGATASVGGAGS